MKDKEFKLFLKFLRKNPMYMITYASFEDFLIEEYKREQSRTKKINKP